MTGMRTLVAVAVLMIGGLVCFGATTAASAAPYTNQVACAVSSTSPTAGGSLTVSGTGFHADSAVAITLRNAGARLGSARTDSAGAFSATVLLPEDVTGSQTVLVQGAAAATDSCSAVVAIGSGTGAVAIGPQGGSGGSAGSAGSGTGGIATGSQSGSSTGGTAYTGVAVLGLSGVGVLLLVGGAALLLAGRRRVQA